MIGRLHLPAAALLPQRRGHIMLNRTEIPERECHFENCIHYADRECLDLESRQYCIEMSLAMLCLDETKEEQNGDKC